MYFYVVWHISPLTGPIFNFRYPVICAIIEKGVLCWCFSYIISGHDGYPQKNNRSRHRQLSTGHWRILSNVGLPINWERNVACEETYNITNNIMKSNRQKNISSCQRPREYKLHQVLAIRNIRKIWGNIDMG